MKKAIKKIIVEYFKEEHDLSNCKIELILVNKKYSIVRAYYPCECLHCDCEYCYTQKYMPRKNKKYRQVFDGKIDNKLFYQYPVILKLTIN